MNQVFLNSIQFQFSVNIHRSTIKNNSKDQLEWDSLVAALCAS